MAVDAGLLAGAAASCGIYADLAYNTYSATNSSPQTTELFAGDRAETLMKYVKIGDVQVLVLGTFGTVLARNWWPLAGAVTVGIVMHAMYAHALKAGNAKQGKTPDGKPVSKGLGW